MESLARRARVEVGVDEHAERREPHFLGDTGTSAQRWTPVRRQPRTQKILAALVTDAIQPSISLQARTIQGHSRAVRGRALGTLSDAR